MDVDRRKPASLRERRSQLNYLAMLAKRAKHRAAKAKEQARKWNRLALDCQRALLKEMRRQEKEVANLRRSS